MLQNQCTTNICSFIREGAKICLSEEDKLKKSEKRPCTNPNDKVVIKE